MNSDAGALTRRARERKSLTIKELADRLGEDDGAWSRLERGTVVNPPAPSVLAGIERELGLTQAQVLAAWGYDLGEGKPVDLEDPRLRRISERLRDLDKRSALEEADLRHIERVLTLAEAVAGGRISDAAVGWIGQRRSSVGP